MSMTLEQAVEILRQHNLWRRGSEELEMLDPKEVGIAIDTVVAALTESTGRACCGCHGGASS